MEYKEYLKTDRWHKVRKEAVINAKGRCQLCNAKHTQLNVHHRSYDCLWHEKPSDVIVLCRECHSLFHHKIILKNGAETKYLASVIMARFMEKNGEAFRQCNGFERIVKMLNSPNKTHRDYISTAFILMVLQRFAADYNYDLVGFEAKK